MDLAGTMDLLEKLASAHQQKQIAEAQQIQAEQAHARAKDTASKIQRKQ